MKQEVFIIKDDVSNGYPSRDLKNTKVVIVEEPKADKKKTKSPKEDKAPIHVEGTDEFNQEDRV